MMVSLGRRWSMFWTIGMVVGIAGFLMSGCAARSAQAPGYSEADVQERLAALETCTQRSQEMIQAALSAGVSPQEMSAASNGAVEAQAALDGARQQLASGKRDAAMAQATQALESCQKHEAMAAQARDAALTAQRQRVADQLGQVTPCIEAARQAIVAAEAAGAGAPEIAPANEALARAEAAVQEAQSLANEGEAAPAAERLKAAEADCRTARNLGNQAGVAAAAKGQALPDAYTVMRGDTLWRISGSQPIYANPFLWPLIYKANRNQIRDPDIIYPEQTFAIPRQVSEEEERVAIRRAQKRGDWTRGDGPDFYILDGVRE